MGIRIRLELAARIRDLPLLDLAIDSKLRACDLTKLRVRDVAHGAHVSSGAIVMQQKTTVGLQRPRLARSSHIRTILFPIAPAASPCIAAIDQCSDLGEDIRSQTGRDAPIIKDPALISVLTASHENTRYKAPLLALMRLRRLLILSDLYAASEIPRRYLTRRVFR